MSHLGEEELQANLPFKASRRKEIQANLSCKEDTLCPLLTCGLTSREASHFSYVSKNSTFERRRSGKASLPRTGGVVLGFGVTAFSQSLTAVEKAARIVVVETTPMMSRAHC